MGKKDLIVQQLDRSSKTSSHSYVILVHIDKVRRRRRVTASATRLYAKRWHIIVIIITICPPTVARKCIHDI